MTSDHPPGRDRPAGTAAAPRSSSRMALARLCSCMAVYCQPSRCNIKINGISTSIIHRALAWSFACDRVRARAWLFDESELFESCAGLRMCMQMQDGKQQKNKRKTRQCRKQAKGENGRRQRATSTHSDGAASTAPLRNRQQDEKKRMQKLRQCSGSALPAAGKSRRK